MIKHSFAVALSALTLALVPAIPLASQHDQTSVVSACDHNGEPFIHVMAEDGTFDSEAIREFAMELDDAARSPVSTANEPEVDSGLVVDLAWRTLPRAAKSRIRSMVCPTLDQLREPLGAIRNLGRNCFYVGISALKSCLPGLQEVGVCATSAGLTLMLVAKLAERLCPDNW